MFRASWGSPVALLGQLHARQEDRNGHVIGCNVGVTGYIFIGRLRGPKILPITAIIIIIIIIIISPGHFM
jgi:hypothetical protein